MGNASCIEHVEWQRARRGKSLLVKREGNSRLLGAKRSQVVDGYEFVLVGILRRPTFLDFEDMQALSDRCPSAVISACPATPILLDASRQVKRNCRSIEASIGHFDADKVHSLLFNGEPLIRFPPFLKGIGDRPLMSDNSPSHCYNSDALVQFWSACRSVARNDRDLPQPADEDSLARYDDGCWVSRPLPIYGESGGLVLPRNYRSKLPGSLVEVHVTVAYGHHPGSRTEGFFFDVQRLMVLPSCV
ncbi:hypothetical protein QCA50_010774 [Cerrena zonata]|uniref:Uncharacterized protein n=1 Tax=Cerrena zonata TaxID=2478898 RepID=A0AAW0G2Q8_9APHY